MKILLAMKLHADIMANFGREKIDPEDENIKNYYDCWRFITKNSINTVNKQNIRERNQFLWRQDINKSVYGKTAYEYCVQYGSQKHFRNENKRYTRKHMNGLQN